MVECPSCGAQNAEGPNCSRCGSQLAAAPNPPAPVPAVLPSFGATQGQTMPASVMPGQYMQPQASVAQRRRTWPILVGVGIVLAVLVGGAFTAWAVFFSKTGGASSPEQAVSRMAESISDGDLIQAVLLLPPGELSGLKNALDVTSDATQKLGLTKSASANDLIDGIDIEFSQMTYKVEEINADLAKVEITGGRLTTGYDIDDLSPKIRDIIGDGLDSTAGSNTINLADSSEPIYVMTVRRDGGWYVSPMFTAAQYASESSGTTPASVTMDDLDLKGGRNAEEAGATFLAGIAEFASSDGNNTDALTSVLSPDLALLVKTYSSELSSSPSSNFGSTAIVDVTSATFTSKPGPDGTVLLYPKDISIRIESGSSTTALSWTSNCLSITSAGNNSEICGSEYEKNGLNKFALVAEENSGKWSINMVGTLFNMYSSWLHAQDGDTLRWYLTAAGLPQIITADDLYTLQLPLDEKSDVDIANGKYSVVSYTSEGTDPFSISIDESSLPTGAEVSLSVVDPSGASAESYGDKTVAVNKAMRGEYKIVVYLSPSSQGSIKTVPVTVSSDLYSGYSYDDPWLDEEDPLFDDESTSSDLT